MSDLCNGVVWLYPTDPDLGAADDEYEDADSPDDVTSALSEGEAIIDGDTAAVTTDGNGCNTDVYADTLCYADQCASPPKTKKFRHIRIRGHIPITKRRIKKKPAPKMGGGG